MFTAILALITLICVLLILVVLVQNSKSTGGVSSFQSNTSNLIGVKRTSDLLENITWSLAIGLLVLCLSTNFILNDDGDGTQQINSVNVERAQESRFQQPAASPQPSTEKTAE